MLLLRQSPVCAFQMLETVVEMLPWDACLMSWSERSRTVGFGIEENLKVVLL